MPLSQSAMAMLDSAVAIARICLTRRMGSAMTAVSSTAPLINAIKGFLTDGIMVIDEQAVF